jgi:hypothetical protein
MFLSQRFVTQWLSAGVLCTILTGCATRPTQQSLRTSHDVYKSGDITRSIAAFEEAYKNQRAKDTPYFLEKGYLSRLKSKDALSESSLTLLEADKVVSDWQRQATLDLGRTTVDFMNYFFSPIRSGSVYELKDFEKSMLSYSLALNHVLAGRMDLAAIEARKMAEREKLIERLQEKKLEAINEKERENSSKNLAGFSRIENIEGYPVNLISHPAVDSMRNSYQNAAAHYLAAFLFESQGDISLAAPGYRLAIELRPEVTLFKQSLADLESSTSRIIRPRAHAETLIVVESGFIPRVNSHSSTHSFQTARGPRLVTFRLPAIGDGSQHFPVRSIIAGTNEVPLSLAANLDLMARRHLKDEMPGHVLRATTQAIAQIAVQEAIYQSQKRNRQGNEGAAMLGAILAGAALSFGNVDVRSWTTLPSAIHLGRVQLQKGMTTLKVNTPVGIVSADLNIQNDYEVVYVRVLNNGAVVSKRPSEPLQAYLSPVTKTVELKEKSPRFSLFPAANASSGQSTTLPARDTTNETAASQDTSAFLSDVNCRMQEGINALSALFGNKDSGDSAKPMSCK